MPSPANVFTSPSSGSMARSPTAAELHLDQVGNPRFHKSPKVTISETPAQVTRKDPALDEIVSPGEKIEKLAGGFLFTEGPIWVPHTEETDGYLLFSDPTTT